MLDDALFEFSPQCIADTVHLGLELHGVRIFLNTCIVPFVGVGQEFVLHTGIVTHHELLSRLEVVEEEIGLAGFQNCAHKRASPVEVCLRRINERNAEGETSQRIHLNIELLLVVHKDIIKTDLEFAACFPGMLRHILQPADDGHAVVIVAVIDKAHAQVLCGIVGQGCFGDGAATDGFPVADSDVALAFLQFVNLDGQATCKHEAISILLLCLAHNIPHLVIINNVIRREADKPFARSLVAPVSVGDAIRQVVSIAEMTVFPSPWLYYVKGLYLLRHRLKDECEVKRVCRQCISVVESYHCGIFDGVLFTVSFYKGALGYTYPRPLPIFDTQPYFCAVGEDSYLCDFAPIHVSIANDYVVPDFLVLLCPARRCYEGEQDSDDG